MAKGPILEITDGTSANTINMINPGMGYHLCGWNPVRPEIEYQMATDWFTGFERPTSLNMKPHAEAFVFTNNARSQDKLFALEAKFNRVLLLAAKFWAGDRNVKRPFYLRVKAKDETYERYGLILSTRLHGSNNPFASPVSSRRPASRNLSVAISHDMWQDRPPGIANDANTDLYSILESRIHAGLSPGVPEGFPTKAGEICLANYHSESNISHIFRGADATNLVDYVFSGPVDQHLLYQPSDGYVYFGAEVTPGNTEFKWFNSLVMHVTTGSTGGSRTWEISTGGGFWLDISTDINQALETYADSRLIRMSWDFLGGWDVNTVNSVDGYWIRMSVPDRTMYSVGYHPYAASWPYVDITNDGHGDAGIDLDVAVRRYNGYVDDPFDNYEPRINRVIVGAREVNGLDEKFTPYVSPSLMNISATLPTVDWTPLPVENDVSYARYAIEVDLSPYSTLVPALSIATATFDENGAKYYVGTYRAFLRMSIKTGILEEGKMRFWMNVIDSGYGQYRKTSSTRKVTDGFSNGFVTVLDLGSVRMGSNKVGGFGVSGGVVSQTLEVMFEPLDTSIPSGETLYLYDIVLMPQDMWYADISIPGSISEVEDELLLSSATSVLPISSVVRDESTQRVLQTPSITPGKPISFFTDNNIRLYFMMMDDWTVKNGAENVELPIGGVKTKLKTSFNRFFLATGNWGKVNKYLGGRGDQGEQWTFIHI